MTTFDDAISLEPQNDLTEDEVSWSGHMTKDWSIGRVPNGGYSSALNLGAMIQHTGQPVARSMTNHYYRPAVHGAPAIVNTEIRRRGRTMVHCDATLVQEGKVRLRSVGVLAITRPTMSSPRLRPRRFLHPTSVCCEIRGSKDSI